MPAVTIDVASPVVCGASGPAAPLLHTATGLSFWGGVDPVTSEVVDHTHPLRGRALRGAVLALPNGRGSCTGSQVVLEML
jgi:predicted aconitase with swiveling domain